MQNLNQLQEIPPRLRGDIIEKAFEKAEFIKLPKAEQEKYHRNLKVYKDLINSFETAHNKGFQRGVEEGIEQGIEQGIEKGKQQEKLELAKNLLDVLDIQTIAVKTGLSVKEIEDLKS